MAKFLIVDCETTGHPDAGEWLPPVEADPKLFESIEPDSRLKDPVKVAANMEAIAARIAARPTEIAASIAERTEERDSKLGLDIDCNRIVCLGYHDTAQENPTVNVFATEEEERNGLRLFWDQVTTNTRLITFNGIKFDLPVLIMRSLLLNVKHTPVVVAPAWKSPHIDLWESLSLGGARRDVKGLKFYAKRFGFPQFDDITGADVARLVKENTVDGWNQIANHCACDVATTHLLARKLGVV